MAFQRRRIAQGLILAWGLACVVMLGAPSAGDRDHEDGAFLRFWAGTGGAYSELETSQGDLKLSGTASEINFAVGGIVSPNLALHATLYGWMVNDPDAKLAGLPADVQGDLDLTAVGGGLTYYIMPMNLYISGTLGFGSLRLEHTPVGSSTTDVGLVIDASIGKEWWVGDHWGLGGATGFGYHSIPLEDSDRHWRGTSLTMRFSATMN